MTSVTIFNASPIGMQMAVNNGAPFAISGVSPGNWTPQAPSSGGPSWSNTTLAQNVIAPGQNYLNITPQGTVVPLTVQMALPRSFQWTSLQLFVFFNGYGDVSWTVLNDGQYVTGNIQLSS